MSEDHVARVLKMLEEGRISAEEARSLISAVAPASSASPQPPPAVSARPAGENGGSIRFGTTLSEGRSGPNAAQSPSAGTSAPPPPPGEASDGRSDQGAHSFDFGWNRRNTFPFDLSSLGRQISGALRGLDPERILRDARTGVTKGSARWRDRLRDWAGSGEFEPEMPTNHLDQPTAHMVDQAEAPLRAGGVLQAENPFGEISITTEETDHVKVTFDRTAWSVTEAEAAALLREIRLSIDAPASETGPARLSIRVEGPDHWPSGQAHIRLITPAGVDVKARTIFGTVQIEKTAGEVEVQTAGGRIIAERLGGRTHLSSLSGDIRVYGCAGELMVDTKSGTIHVEDASHGALLASVSGGIEAYRVQGGRMEMKTISGDILAEEITAGTAGVLFDTVSGSLRGRALCGQITLKSLSGDADLEQITSETLQAQSVSGSMHLAFAVSPKGTVTVNSVTGSVSLEFGTSVDLRFTLVSQTGRMSCSLPITDSARTDTLWSAAAGDGTGILHVQTLSGNISLDAG